MPRSNREYLLRFADQAINDLERCLGAIEKIIIAYKGGTVHPDGSVDEIDPVAPPDPDNRYAEYINAFREVGIIIAKAHTLLKTLRTDVM